MKTETKIFLTKNRRYNKMFRFLKKQPKIIKTKTVVFCSNPECSKYQEEMPKILSGQFCSHCGGKLKEKKILVKIRHTCGKKIFLHGQPKYCEYCGQKIDYDNLN